MAARPAVRRSTTTCSPTWPREAVNHRSRRFVNDRVHANIQKDGTFSVIPRIRGGVTNAAELRKIADVAEKFGCRW